MKEIIETNDCWKEDKTPFITIITPVYNRRKIIRRVIKSIEKQTFRDIEYIIIDDGSTEMIDDIVHGYMMSLNIPMMFVKKQNGGVHTARNVGYRYARGELLICIDSDDELTPDACQILYDTWQSIPKKKKNEIQQIKAQCVDQNGKLGGPLFPNNINDLPNEKARKYFMTDGERIGCHVTKIMKKNLYPEPKGVTLVSESVRLVPLEQKYRSWAVNDAIRIWHKEGDDHLTGEWKNKKQRARNMYWSRTYMLNRRKVFYPGFLKYFSNMAKYSIFRQELLRYDDGKFVKNNRLKGFWNNIWKNIFKIPAIIYISIFTKKDNNTMRG